MKTNREKLLKILTSVRPGLAKKDIVEQATHFIFTGKEITTYNDQICISHPFKTDFQCSIPADEFYKVLTRLSSEEIELSYEEDKLIIKTKRTSAGLSTVVENKVVEMIETLELSGLDSKWASLPKDFLEGMFLCMFSASKDQTQKYLICLRVEKDSIVSSDDVRISHYGMDSDIEDRFLIPAVSVVELVKFEVKKFYVGNSWVYFSTDDRVVFCSRIVKEDYPDVDEYFQFEGARLRLPTELKDSVEMVSILAEGDFDIDKKIEIKIADGKISCRGEREIGWIENELDVKFSKDKSIEFAINPIFFSQILGKSTTVIIGENRALFVSGSFKHLISLYQD